MVPGIANLQPKQVGYFSTNDLETKITEILSPQALQESGSE